MRINILNKQGMLSDDDRKQPLEHNCEHLWFQTCLDLSKPINVYPFGNTKEITVNQYSSDVASFFTWWTNFVHKDLSGFSGFSNVKFNLVGFKIVPDAV